MPLTIIKVALDFLVGGFLGGFFFWERESEEGEEIKKWADKETIPFSHFYTISPGHERTALVVENSQVWLVNKECFTADEEHDFNFQATSSGNCNGGKKGTGLSRLHV